MCVRELHRSSSRLIGRLQLQQWIKTQTMIHDEPEPEPSKPEPEPPEPEPEGPVRLGEHLLSRQRSTDRVRQAEPGAARLRRVGASSVSRCQNLLLQETNTDTEQNVGVTDHVWVCLFVCLFYAGS
ncbi:hypothetical protein F2P81_017800 [Scophthalmus maximus]|uniref:Uncharacterized protein n=1 Tax=Scophthalmus maximus TaxID=52904 RepID=A0A6A4S8R8_SCOMX|nr:hypothetical protein F2P81_017800 [Scophthalmus maximus]